MKKTSGQKSRATVPLSSEATEFASINSNAALQKFLGKTEETFELVKGNSEQSETRVCGEHIGGSKGTSRLSSDS
jgi:hypothetical protein